MDYLWENFETELTDDSLDVRTFQYALCQYNLGHPELAFGKTLDNYVLSINITFELGLYDICKAYLEAYKEILENTEEQFDVGLIWTAEKVGAFDLAENLYNGLENIYNNNALIINKAHVLLMVDDKENALSLYRNYLNEPFWKYEIEKDFSVFRWLGFSETEISFAERELKLNKIEVYTNPNDEENTALTIPFIGNWQCEENGYLINWEIKNNYNLCSYLIQKRNTVTNQWDDYNIAVTRYRMKKIGDKTILEEYNSRTNILTVGEIEKINDNEIHVKIIESGDPKDSGKIRIYKRITE